MHIGDVCSNEMVLGVHYYGEHNRRLIDTFKGMQRENRIHKRIVLE